MPFLTASNVYFNQQQRQVYYNCMIDHLATLQSITGKEKQIAIKLQSLQKQVQAWLSKSQLKTTTKQMKNSVHIRSLEQGFEIEFQNGKLQTFFAYFRSKKISCFDFPLKFGINKGWNIKGTVMYLGQPLQKSSKTVEIIYPHLGLGLVFLGSYNNEDSLIDYIYLYAPQNLQVCAACKKQFKDAEDHGRLYNKDLKVNICKCKIVKYCSEKCEKKHYRQHLIFCEEGLL